MPKRPRPVPPQSSSLVSSSSSDRKQAQFAMTEEVCTQYVVASLTSKVVQVQGRGNCPPARLLSYLAQELRKKQNTSTGENHAVVVQFMGIRCISPGERLAPAISISRFQSLAPPSLGPEFLRARTSDSQIPFVFEWKSGSSASVAFLLDPVKFALSWARLEHESSVQRARRIVLQGLIDEIGNCTRSGGERKALDCQHMTEWLDRCFGAILNETRGAISTGQEALRLSQVAIGGNIWVVTDSKRPGWNWTIQQASFDQKMKMDIHRLMITVDVHDEGTSHGKWATWAPTSHRRLVVIRHRKSKLSVEDEFVLLPRDTLRSIPESILKPMKERLNTVGELCGAMTIELDKKTNTLFIARFVCAPSFLEQGDFKPLALKFLRSSIKETAAKSVMIRRHFVGSDQKKAIQALENIGFASIDHMLFSHSLELRTQE